MNDGSPVCCECKKAFYLTTQCGVGGWFVAIFCGCGPYARISPRVTQAEAEKARRDFEISGSWKEMV